MVVIWENNHYRANGEATHAREQLQRTSGFADGSGAVFLPQVEAFEKESAGLSFTDTSLTFGTFFFGRCRLGRVLARGLRFGLRGRQVRMRNLDFPNCVFI